MKRVSIAVLGVIGVITLVEVGSANATDNSTARHWHNASPIYRLHVDLPNKNVVEAAANTWSINTRITFRRGSNIAHTRWWENPHIVWQGNIPQAWQGDCPPNTTLACTRTRWGNDNHIDDSDFVFSGNRLWTTNCVITTPPFFDRQTVALHEFGHWGYLTHTADSNAVMFGSYQGSRCTLRAHDINSMNRNYQGH